MTQAETISEKPVTGGAEAVLHHAQVSAERMAGRYGLALTLRSGDWDEVFKHAPAVDPERFL